MRSGLTSEISQGALAVGFVAMIGTVGLTTTTAQAQTAASGYSIQVAATGLNNPMEVAADLAGFVYVSDSGNGRILKGQMGGPFTPIVSGIAVAPFIGVRLGPTGLAVSGNSLFWGEAGRDTGVEQVFEASLSGVTTQALAPTDFGGNWTGLTVDASGQLLAVSANGDKVYAASRLPGGQWSEFGVLIDGQQDGLVSPTGVAEVGNTIYVSYYGSFGGMGYIASYNSVTAELISANVVADLFAPTAIEAMPDGRLLVVEYGFDTADGVLSIFNPANGSREIIVTGLSRATGVAYAADGSIYVSEQGAINQSGGRLLRVVPTPGAFALLGMAGVVVARRRR